MMLHYYINIVGKKLIKGKRSKGGRNNYGRVCVRGVGGGNKRLYRYIDFYKRVNQFGRIIHICYDTNRTAKLAVIRYNNGLVSYNILQKNIKINTKIFSGSYLPKEIEKTDIKNGFSLPIKYMPLFSVLSNIEIRPFKGAVLVRAAETSSVLIGKDIKNGYLKLRSGWNYKVNNYCMSSVGANSNRMYNNEVIAKAGKNRALGRKPKVRGVAKNPCDHPHGGANGKKNNPVIPKNAWSTVFKWRHTNNKVFQNIKRRKYKNV